MKIFHNENENKGEEKIEAILSFNENHDVEFCFR